MSVKSVKVIAQRGKQRMEFDSIKEAAYSFEKIKILDDKFIADKKAKTDSKSAYTDKEREAGRSTD